MVNLIRAVRTKEKTDWIKENWGVSPTLVNNGKYIVCFGSPEEYATSGVYCNRRRAKKEITHYIERGAARGPYHGIYRHFDKATGRFN